MSVVSAIVALLALSAFLPHAAAANSGFVAYAAPVEGIQVDGSLVDWPAELPSQQLEAVYKAFGAYDTEDPQATDLAASFRAAWCREAQRVYVAVVVIDDRLTLGSGVTDTDVCEVYFDADGSDGPDEPQQYLMFPGDGSYNIFGTSRNPTLTDGDVDASGVEGSWSVAGDTLTYEWSLRPYAHTPSQPLTLKPWTRIGFDAVAVDKDEEERGSTWLSWSPGGGKVGSPSRIGEIVLVHSPEAVARMARIRGRVVQPGSGEGWRGVVVRAEREDEALASAVSGPNGVFGLTVPAGPVKLRAMDVEPPAELALTTHVGATVEVELAVASRSGASLPTWPFMLTLGLFTLAAGVSILAMGRHAELLGGVVVRPATTFAQLARDPEWAAPCGLALAVAALAAIAQVNLLPGQLWGALMGMPGALATALMVSVPIFLFISYLAAAFGSWLAWAACLWGLARLGGMRSRYFHLVSVVGYAGVPWLLGACVAALATAWGWQDAGPWLSRLTGLALWIDGGGPVGQMLARVELFSLWTWVLGTMGATHALQTTWRRAAALNGACWGLYLGGVYVFFAVSRHISAGLAGGGP